MKKSDKETLCEVGEALFGPSWLGPLGRAVGIEERTFRRMVYQGEAIYPATWEKIAALCEQRGDILRDWASRLRSEPEGP